MRLKTLFATSLVALLAASSGACDTSTDTPFFPVDGGQDAASGDTTDQDGAGEDGVDPDVIDNDTGGEDVDPDAEPTDVDPTDVDPTDVDPTDTTPDTTPDVVPDTTPDVEPDTGPDAWPDTGVRILSLDRAGAASDLVTFDDGERLDNLDWAQGPNVGCWNNSTTTPFFEGEHVLFALDRSLPEWSEVTITVTPDDRVEANLYVLEQGANQYNVPPAVDNIPYCHRTLRLGNAGEETSITFRVHPGQERNVLFGISRRTSGRDGNVAVSVQVNPVGVREQCYEDTVAPVRWADHVTPIVLNEDGEFAGIGNINEGARVCGDLQFLDDAFCVPETQLDRFAGNHRFYQVEGGIPERSVMTITVTPDPGVDVNLYGAWQGTTFFEIPPTFSTFNCESSTSYSSRNPGVSETISFVATTNPYNIFFAVAGDNTQGSEGGYTISIDLYTADPTDLCTEEEYDEVRGLDDWPRFVTRLTSSGDGYTATGDLGDADPLCTLDWAADSSVACFPATQNTSWNGNWQFFALPEPPPAGSNVTVSVQPNGRNIDVNLLGMRMGTQTFFVPPFVPSVVNCDVSFPQEIFTVGTNPGEREEITFYNPTSNQYNYLFAVAAPDGVDTGEFTISVEVDEPPPAHCPESLPGGSYPTWPGVVERVAVDRSGRGSVDGNLEDGACTNVNFMADSSVACVPATQFSAFEGSHVFYALDEPIPPRSSVTITLEPEAGADLNLYGYQVGTTSFMVPPNVPGVVTCNAGTSDPRVENPGEAESITFYNPSDANSYNIFFAVAGAENVDNGEYTVDVVRSVAPVHCFESFDRPMTYTDWPSNVTPYSIEDGAVSGNVSTGSCVNLEFADDSDVACFPAVDWEPYEGLMAEYYVEELVQPGTIVNVRVSPDARFADLNIFGYLIGADDVIVPPHVPSVVTCEATVAPRRLTGPGETETIQFNNPVSNPSAYRLYLGVGSPSGVTDAPFELEVEFITGAGD